MVPPPSIHTDRSPPDTADRHTERRTAVAPPPGVQTESLPRGNPPLGKMLSSSPIPVATTSVRWRWSGTASGNLRSSSSRRSRKAEDAAMSFATNVYPDAAGGLEYTE